MQVPQAMHLSQITRGLTVNASLNIGLVGELDFNVTFYDRYNRHPAIGFDRNDYGLLLGLRWNN